MLNSHFRLIGNSQWFLLLAASGLMALVLGADLPSWPKIFGVLNNAAHAPVFGMLALIVLRLLSARRWLVAARSTDYGIAFLITVGVGGAVEFVQSFIGRDASWGDLGTDALGAGCALGLAAAFDWRVWRVKTRSTGRVLMAAAGLLCGLWALYPVGEATVAYVDRAAKFPVLAQFASPFDLYFLSSRTAHLSLEPLPYSWSQPDDRESMRIDFAADLWPGVSHDEPPADWRGFSTLALDLTNPQETPLSLTVRVHDVDYVHRYEDRFNRSFRLAPLSRGVIRIPVRDIAHGPIGRELDLARIAGLAVFENSRKDLVGRYFYLTRIWLE